MTKETGCRACRAGSALDFDFSMAFQPIVDVGTGSIWAYEALVRGPNGEPAPTILSRVTDENRYQFDQAARVRAIELAGRLFPRDSDTRLSINFMPNAVYEPVACIRASLEAARRVDFAHQRLMFEFTEQERFRDIAHVQRIVTAYRKQGFLTALDDFGAGFAGLSLLANFRPDLIKVDMDLLRGLDTDAGRHAIVSGVVAIARALGVTVLAEGIETAAEREALRALGIDLMQGYHFAKPMLEALPPVAGFAPKEAARAA
ncbi:EAL domain, c-di-GMP-specific phosphodiesterase class I (or its enzymatically inactive variant) [Methylobacterium phyllostachyos]|uniref:EAL domain, c-di-GMP-specific phosphodiesterase class I (Or its enzymatically inactive variant) n=1 Tax=Methylobacterium phyllostachyos TaxID=582672 RepID=A0A1G9V0L2_9HYPH|nr:EAL domain-containing protein [Methylobacterium phyllostachyos]SDM65610.1 EAL domain, c-di-GMP-specific phosphodiesterase class I (or its enzymatically inactive variant) [Methylobacterium phyllostachyos]